MVAQPKYGHDDEYIVMSEADYLAMEREAEIRHEYMGGRVYAMAEASEVHIDIMMALGASLYNALGGRPCKVYAADMRVHVASIEFVAGDALL